jgi:hypothetical protein
LQMLAAPRVSAPGYNQARGCDFSIESNRRSH